MQAQILNEIDLSNAAGPSLLAGSKALGSALGMIQTVGSWLERDLKMSSPGGKRVQLGVGLWW